MLRCDQWESKKNSLCSTPNPTTLRPSQIPAKKAGKSPKKLIADGFDFEPDLQRKKFPNTKFNRCNRIYIYIKTQVNLK